MPTPDVLDTAALRATVATFRDAVRAHAERINRMNVYPVPDGDTGTNMSRTLDAVVEELDGAPADGVATCDAISHGSLMGARGNSGVILSQIMRGLAGTLKPVLAGSEGDGASGGASGSDVAAALSAASTAAYQAVLKPIEGTILTVVRASAERATAIAGGGAPLVDVLRAARDAASAALDETPELLPVLKDAGVVDAGGAGYLLLLDAALHVVAGEPLPDVDATAFAAPVPAMSGAGAHGAEHDGTPSVADLRYEVMYFLELGDERIDDFKRSWGEIGDSIVVVGGDGLWNCHVHTNDIGAAIESAIGLDGRPKQIRVTDLFGEIAEEHDRRQAEVLGESVVMPVAPVSPVPLPTPPPSATRSIVGLPAVETAVVAVASGDGIAGLFVQLGVQGIVHGGQTLNPSTAELLDFVDRVNADQVIVLPNNKNIIAVAEQVDALTTRSVVVVPTVSMPEAFGALMVYDPEADAATNADAMAGAIDGITTGEITRAVRDSTSDAGPVAEGDWIGLVRGDGIVAIAGSLEDAAVALLRRLVGDAHELVTVIAGEGATAEATAKVAAWAGEAGVELEVHEGGQPLYPYLFGVE